MLVRRLGRKGIPGVHASGGVSKGGAALAEEKGVGAEAGFCEEIPALDLPPLLGLRPEVSLGTIQIGAQPGAPRLLFYFQAPCRIGEVDGLAAASPTLLHGASAG